MRAESEILTDFWKIESDGENSVLRIRQKTERSNVDRVGRWVWRAGLDYETRVRKLIWWGHRQEWGLLAPSLFPNRWTIGPRVLCPKSETESTFLGKLSHLLEWNADSNTGVTTLQWSPPCLALGEPHTPTHQILSMYPKAKLASHLPGSQTWSSLHQCHPLWEAVPDRPR